MKATLLVIFLFVVLLVPAAKTDDLLSISPDSAGLMYQVHINSGSNAVQYDTLSFKPERRGYPPRGVSVYIKFADKRPDYHFSSYWAINGRAWTPLYTTVGTNFASTNYPIETVMGGLELKLNSTQVDEIEKIKLQFSTEVRVNGIESLQTAESSWFNLNDQLRQKIKNSYNF